MRATLLTYRLVDLNLPRGVVTEADEGHDWSLETGRTMAGNLVTVARALEGWRHAAG